MIHHHYEILLILGISAFVGMFGAWFFQKLRIPQVVGYVFVGIMLGLIGFLVGG